MVAKNDSAMEITNQEFDEIINNNRYEKTPWPVFSFSTIRSLKVSCQHVSGGSFARETHTC